MNTIGKKNMIFGFAYIIITVCLGIFLGNKLGTTDPNWANSTAHHLLKAAHAHGNLEGVLNIIIGLILCRYGSKTLMLTKVASILAIAAAVFHSGMLLLGGLGLLFAMKLGIFGGVSMLATMILMIVILYKGVTEEQ
ncbi:MAG: hypothetical protein ABUK01_08865 [Leptospirales bacterium]